MKPAPSLHSHSGRSDLLRSPHPSKRNISDHCIQAAWLVLDQALLSARITVAPASGKGACGRKAYA